jgi:hypothetical protein
MADPAGRLLSVNVGMPRDIEWEGRTVRTVLDVIRALRAFAAAVVRRPAASAALI